MGRESDFQDFLRTEDHFSFETEGGQEKAVALGKGQWSEVCKILAHLRDFKQNPAPRLAC